MPKTVNTYMDMITNGTNVSFNPLDNLVEITKNHYSGMITEADYTSYINRYTWSGLPDNISPWIIESMLYYRASLIGFFNGDTFLVTPYTQVGGINVYGLPIKVRSVPFNGASSEINKESPMGMDLSVSYAGDTADSAKAAILYDHPPMFRNGAFQSRFILNKEINNQLAEILARVKNNIKNSDEKIVYYVADEDQRVIAQRMFENAYDNDCPFIVRVKGATEMGIQNDSLHEPIALQAQAYMEAYQSLMNIRSQCEGFDNGGAFLKKERRTAGENAQSSGNSEVIGDSGLTMRQLWLDQLKLIFPDHADILGKITVSINESSGESEGDEDGQSDKAGDGHDSISDGSSGGSNGDSDKR